MTKRVRPRRNVLTIEPLESRKLLAVSIVQPDGDGFSQALNKTSGAINEFAVVGDNFFIQPQGNSSELWVTDPKSTVTEKILVDGARFDALTPTANGKLFFLGASSQLWVLDSRNSQPRPVFTALDTNGRANPITKLTALGNHLYFVTDADTKGNELWRSDGTNTERVTDIFIGANNSNPSFLVSVGNKLFFTAKFNDGDTRVFYTTANSKETTTVVEIARNLGVRDAFEQGGLYYIVASDTFGQFSYTYKTDGTTTEQVSKQDFIYGSVSTGNTFFYSGNTFPTGYYLKSINASGDTTTVVAPSGNEIRNLTAVDHGAFFTVKQADRGEELWFSDGTVSGTHIVIDIVPGTVGSNPTNLISFDKGIFFTATDATGDKQHPNYYGDPTTGKAGTGRELWYSEGTFATTQFVANIYKGQDDFFNAYSSNPENLIRVDQTLYFTALIGDRDRRFLKLENGPNLDNPPSVSTPIVLSTLEDLTSEPIEFVIADDRSPIDSLVINSIVSSNTELVPNRGMVHTRDGENQTLLITPAPNEFGTTTIAITVTDAAGMTSTTEFNFTVTSVNDLPTISVIENKTVPQDERISGIQVTVSDLETNDSDLSLSFASSDESLVDSSKIASTGITGLRAITILPEPGRSGTATITVTVNDDDGGKATTTFDLHVSYKNQPPKISGLSDILASSGERIETIEFTLSDDLTSVEDLVLQSIVSSNTELLPNENITVKSIDGSATLWAQLSEKEFGSTDVTIAYLDESNAIGKATFTIEVPDTSPSVSEIMDVVVKRGESIPQIPFTISDDETEISNLQWNVTSSNSSLLPDSNLSITAEGSSHFIRVEELPTQLGSTTISIAVTDESGFTKTESFQLTILSEASLDFVVTNAADSGPGSLRQALIDANNRPGMNRIGFDIAGVGVRTIRLRTALPEVVDPIILDATTQSGYLGIPLIEIDGTDTQGADGLNITAGSSTVAGLAIGGFEKAGIALGLRGANTLTANHLGTDATGQTARSNGVGIRIDSGASENHIGRSKIGETQLLGNVVSGNRQHGISVGVTSDRNRMVGNLIGTDVFGKNPLPNQMDGILLDNSSANIIGGADVGFENIISGNGRAGVMVQGPKASGNWLAGNFIGLASSGTVAISNSTGVQLQDGAHNNIIGTNGDEVDDAFETNVISGNRVAGVTLTNANTDANRISGNLIGPSPLDALSIEATQTGIVITNGAQNNVIGTNGDGFGDANESNLISGNHAEGILITGRNTKGTIVAGNLIGVSRDAHRSLANESGVLVDEGASQTRIGSNSDGRSDTLEANIISGNRTFGVAIAGTETSKTTIAGNFIGTDREMNPLSNLGSGIIINNAFNNVIGGDLAGSANVISGNLHAGVQVEGDMAIQNRISRNSIFLNGALGINLGVVGVNTNDPEDTDVGPNALQNSPSIRGVTFQGQSGEMAGVAFGLPNSKLRLEFFSNSKRLANTEDEGQDFLLSTDVVTNELGEAPFLVPFTAPLLENESITATATDSLGNTSEFSKGIAINTGVIGGDAGILVTESSGSTFVSEIRVADSFTLQLESQPSSEVVLNVLGAKLEGLNVSPGRVVFTPENWNEPRTILVETSPGSLSKWDHDATIDISVEKSLSAVAYQKILPKRIELQQVNPSTQELKITRQGKNLRFFDATTNVVISQSTEKIKISIPENQFVEIGSGWRLAPTVFDAAIVYHRLIATDVELWLSNSLVWTNPIEPADVDRNGSVTALDALAIINWLGRQPESLLPLPTEEVGISHYYDVNSDGNSTALDALRVINAMLLTSGQGEQILEPMDVLHSVTSSNEVSLNTIHRSASNTKAIAEEELIIGYSSDDLFAGKITRSEKLESRPDVDYQESEQLVTTQWESLETLDRIIAEWGML